MCTQAKPLSSVRVCGTQSSNPTSCVECHFQCEWLLLSNSTKHASLPRYVCMYSSNKIAIGLVPITQIACSSRVHSVGLHSLARLVSGWPLAMGVLCMQEFYAFVCLYCKALNVLMPCHPAVQWPSIENIWQAKCRPKLICWLDL